MNRQKCLRIDRILVSGSVRLKTTKGNGRKIRWLQTHLATTNIIPKAINFMNNKNLSRSSKSNPHHKNPFSQDKKKRPYKQSLSTTIVSLSIENKTSILRIPNHFRSKLNLASKYKVSHLRSKTRLRPKTQLQKSKQSLLHFSKWGEKYRIRGVSDRMMKRKWRKAMLLKLIILIIQRLKRAIL